jgi:hypothetical protein
VGRLHGSAELYLRRGSYLFEDAPTPLGLAWQSVHHQILRVRATAGLSRLQDVNASTWLARKTWFAACPTTARAARPSAVLSSTEPRLCPPGRRVASLAGRRTPQHQPCLSPASPFSLPARWLSHCATSWRCLGRIEAKRRLDALFFWRPRSCPVLRRGAYPFGRRCTGLCDAPPKRRRARRDLGLRPRPFLIVRPRQWVKECHIAAWSFSSIRSPAPPCFLSFQPPS